MIPENTRTIVPVHGDWKQADGTGLMTTPEINTSYTVAAVKKNKLKTHSALWLVYLGPDNVTCDYHFDGNIEQIRLCYGTVKEITYSVSSGRKRRSIIFSVTHVIRLVDIPSVLPVQPFPLWLGRRINHHLTGARYLGGPGGGVVRDGDYFFFRSNVHGEDEQVIAVKYDNEIRIILTIYINEWKEKITWQRIGNYIPEQTLARFFETR